MDIRDTYRGEKNLFKYIKYYIKSIKWKKQRIRRGYSDYDISDTDRYILYIISDMLKDFKESNFISLPITYENEKEWKNKLTEVNKAWDEFVNLSYNYCMPDDTTKWNEYKNEFEKKKRKAFYELQEVILDLWE